MFKASKATVERAKACEAKSQAILGQAKVDYQRYAGLVFSISISQEMMDKYTQNLAVTRAYLERALLLGGNLPFMMSGGEQQRVVIARALDNKPKIVLADEPTAALESVRGSRVMELFPTVAHGYESTVPAAAHDQMSLDVFDRILEMDDGKLFGKEHTDATHHDLQD